MSYRLLVAGTMCPCMLADPKATSPETDKLPATATLAFDDSVESAKDRERIRASIPSTEACRAVSASARVVCSAAIASALASIEPCNAASALWRADVSESRLLCTWSAASVPLTIELSMAAVLDARSSTPS